MLSWAKVSNLSCSITNQPYYVLGRYKSGKNFIRGTKELTTRSKWRSHEPGTSSWREILSPQKRTVTTNGRPMCSLKASNTHSCHGGLHTHTTLHTLHTCWCRPVSANAL